MDGASTIHGGIYLSHSMSYVPGFSSTTAVGQPHRQPSTSTYPDIPRKHFSARLLLLRDATAVYSFRTPFSACPFLHALSSLGVYLYYANHINVDLSDILVSGLCYIGDRVFPSVTPHPSCCRNVHRACNFSLDGLGS